MGSVVRSHWAFPAFAHQKRVEYLAAATAFPGSWQNNEADLELLKLVKSSAVGQPFLGLMA